MNVTNGRSRANFVITPDQSIKQSLYGAQRSTGGPMAQKQQQRAETIKFKNGDQFDHSNTSSNAFLGSPSRPVEYLSRNNSRMIEVSKGRKMERQGHTQQVHQRKLKVRNAFKPEFRLKSGSSRPDTPEHLRYKTNSSRLQNLPEAELSSFQDGCSLCRTQQVIYDAYDQQQKRRWC